ncbi:hypothetical protein HW132_09720 [Brasilonema sp. CT11]|nr:hypothetical protein [Brasilonema sp. CT11]
MSLGFKSQVDENASLRIVQDFSCYEVIVEAYFLNASNNSTDGKIAFVAQALEATFA